LWPNKGEQDSRPQQGADYEMLKPTAPHSPFVPKGAVGELTIR
jgi:cholesterol oxidase